MTQSINGRLGFLDFIVGDEMAYNEPPLPRETARDRSPRPAVIPQVHEELRAGVQDSAIGAQKNVGCAAACHPERSYTRSHGITENHVPKDGRTLPPDRPTTTPKDRLIELPN